MATNLQTACSNTFYSMKVFKFWFWWCWNETMGVCIQAKSNNRINVYSNQWRHIVLGLSEVMSVQWLPSLAQYGMATAITFGRSYSMKTGSDYWKQLSIPNAAESYIVSLNVACKWLRKKLSTWTTFTSFMVHKEHTKIHLMVIQKVVSPWEWEWLRHYMR